jgi:potassium-dependent mechanosensitive channel
MKYIIFLMTAFLFAGQTLPAQEKITKPKSETPSPKSETPSPKSPPPQPKSRLEYSLDTITDRLDNLHLTLNRINDFTSLGFSTKNVEQQLPEIRANLQTISENLSLSGTVPDFKSMQLYDVLLANIKDQLENWRNSVFKYNIDLISMNNEINSFTHDSLLHQLIRDSTYRAMYTDELTELAAKWRQADTSTHSHLIRLNLLQSGISQLYFQTIDLQNQVGILRNQLTGKLFRKEYNYLWQFSDSDAQSGSATTGTAELARRSYGGQRQIMGYFIRSNWENYIYILLIGGAFFFWVWNNFRRIRKSPEPEKVLQSVALTYLRNYPVLATLVIILSIVPFFDLDAPAGYTHLIQLPLLVILCVFFGSSWPKKFLYYWLFLVLLYVLFSAANIVLVPRMSVRLWLLLLQLLAGSLGYIAIRRIIRHFNLSLVVKIVSILYEVCNVLAILCNVYGRLTLSKILSTSAIFGLVQIIGLAVFVNSLMEAFSLQAAVSKMESAGTTMTLFYSKIHKGLYRLLLFLSTLTWVIVFATNLDLFDPVYGVITRWLDSPRAVGSISFRLGNIVIFILIIYISNVLQKYLGYLFGQQDDHTMPQEGKKGSRLVMMRLIFIIVGFFLAVVASGLPIDKITIVLGALGVGVGLGLQNIVNNLVSGIILIFESPFQIGDYIELNGKKGIVRDMGIRSSRLVTEEGTEIIMPNGDLLSGEVINWTVQNSQVRIEVPMTVETGPTMEQVNDIVQDALKDNPDLSHDHKPKVLLSTANDKTLSFTIVAWVGNIGQIQNLKSEILRLMYLKLKEKGIRTV